MASITSLNDDCLREIFEYCGLEDQVALAQVCERFEAVIQSIWKIYWRQLTLNSSHSDIWIDWPYGENIHIASSTLKYILELIHPFVQLMRLYNNDDWTSITVEQTIKEFRFANATELYLYGITEGLIMNHACFPNIHTLEVNPYELHEYKGVKFSKIMPFISDLKLKRLKIHDLKDPIPDQYKNFEYIIDLEEFVADEFGINEFMEAFKFTIKLKKLSLVFYDYMSQNDFEGFIIKLLTVLEKRVAELTTCFLPSSTSDNFIRIIQNQAKLLPRLKKISVLKYHLKDINMLSSVFPMLKSVVFCGNEVDADDVMNILKIAQLDFIGFSNCCIPRSICLDVAKIGAIRSRPITINVLGELLKIVLSAPSNLIKITNTEGMDLPDFSFEIQCT